ncbi:MAG TPA: DHH family phosphoesterase [bacterium]|nr:DHH family phosphoesterase [bacterium]HOX86928.1 DHH family phosphoesterase [bacterium]HPG46259.1 DHH family phosphoesterase [bacterium]HPM98547.1 DHH family phosphoesterase [bacterium]
MANDILQADNSLNRLKKLSAILSERKRLLIVIHNHPDPDALASAFALRYLLQARFHLPSDIAYDGIIGRAENAAMVRELRIPVKRLRLLKLERYDSVALIDTQPGAGNHAMQGGMPIDLVIDHHPRRRTSSGSGMIIDPQVGSTATLLVEWLLTADLPLPTDVASALSYAIRSETQDLGREASARDIRAYLAIYPHASMQKLSRIINPTLTTNYFIALQCALQRAQTYRHLICAHIGNVHTPEIVAEVADLLLRHRKTSWTLVTGRFHNSLYLSLRSSNTRAQANKLIQHLVSRRESAGGHNQFAGGKIDLEMLTPAEIDQLEMKIRQIFARRLGYKTTEWKPLITKTP